jgi:hypothetical protein
VKTTSFKLNVTVDQRELAAYLNTALGKVLQQNDVITALVADVQSLKEQVQMVK